MDDAKAELRSACQTAGVPVDWLEGIYANYLDDGTITVTGLKGYVFGRIGMTRELLARARLIAIQYSNSRPQSGTHRRKARSSR